MKKILLTLLIATNLSSKTQVPVGMDLTVTGKEPVDIEQIRNLKHENDILREDVGMYMDSVYNYSIDKQTLTDENEELKKKVKEYDDYINKQPGKLSKAISAVQKPLEKTSVSADAKTVVIILCVCFVGGYVLAKSNGITYLVKASSLVDKGVEQTKKGGHKLFGWMKKKAQPAIDATTYQDHLSHKPEAQIFIKKWKRFWHEIKDTEEWHDIVCNACEINVLARDGSKVHIKVPSKEEQAALDKRPWYKTLFNEKFK